MPTTNRGDGQHSQDTNMTTGVNDTSASAATSATRPRRQPSDNNNQSPSAQADSDSPSHTAVESWVEVSSHPSSSSVSSIGDEIVTTGLRVGSNPYTQRRRLHPSSYNQLLAQQQQQRHLAAQAAAASSQEEYEESETDSDHLLSSSTENIASVPSLNPTPLRSAYPLEADTSDEEDDDDENATALGSRRPSESFRPQPNAFSHPPSHLQHRHSTSSAIPQHHPRPSFGQRSSTRVERRGQNFMSSADNDEALRASLTTLLSCAAAARGRKQDDEKRAGERAAQAGSQPVNLRLVPESELMEPAPRPTASGRVLRSDATPSPPATTRSASPEKVKRSATPTPPNKSLRATKKKKTSAAASPSNFEETLISPTLLTWVVGAGVVVLVSVVGFGAGYVIGREVGRQEALDGLAAANASSIATEGGSCGREAIRGGTGTLKRFRWGSGMGRSVAA
ncbi:3'-5' RNA exonuclease complex component [Pestalotiopsis sp. IQ-011]